jgi:electron transport complex protein RnfE
MILKDLKRGVITQNPVLVLGLGLCPAVAVSTCVIDAAAMGVIVLLVLIGSNILTSASRHLVTARIRIPCTMLIVASLVTIVKLLMGAWFPGLERQLGIFVPLVAVNCIILSRAEVCARKKGVAQAAVDGLMTGLGFLCVMVLVGAVRELAGQNTLFGLSVVPGMHPLTVIALAPGGFFVLAALLGVSNALAFRRERNNEKASAAQQSTKHQNDRVYR